MKKSVMFDVLNVIDKANREKDYDRITFEYSVGLSNICYSEDKKSSSIWFGVFQPSGLIGKRL